MARKTKQNRIVFPELWINVSKENKELLNDFIEYCQSKDMSIATIDGYQNDISICWIWNLQNNDNKFFVDFTKKDVMRYQNYLVNTLGNSSNRVRRMKSAVSSLANYIENMLDDEYENYRNIINKVPAPPRQDVREKTVLSEEQVQTLLDYLVDKKKYQQACVVALAVASGARKSELLRFKVSHFNDENIIYGSLYKTPEKIKTKGRGSKGKPLVKYVIVNRFKPYFDLWMTQRKELGIEGEEIFWNKRNGVWKPTQVSTLNSYAMTFSNILGIDFYFHANRHFFTTALCKANVPADVIKDIVGWESTNMVSVYNDTEIDEELEKYFDVDGIKQNEKQSLGNL